MNELERRVRDHVHRVVDAVEPVSMDDIRSRAHVPELQPARPSGPARRPSLLMAVAACVLVLAVGLGFVVGRWSATERTEDRIVENVPSDTARADPLVTLPEPTLIDSIDPDPLEPDPIDPIDEVMETSIGSISWTRVEGEVEEMPRRVTGRRGPALFGDSWDPTVNWSSTDGGMTWNRSQTDGVYREAGGHDWVRRYDDEVAESPRLSRVTADGDVDVVVEGASDDVPDGWTSSVWPSDLPVELGGEAFLLTNTWVRADLRGVARELEVRHLNLSGRHGSITFQFDPEQGILEGNSPAGRALDVAARPDSRIVDLIDPDGAVVATFDASFGPFEDVDPLEAVMHGVWTSQWSVFDGDRFVPVEVPWPGSANTDLVRVGDEVMVVAQPMHTWTGADRVSVWTTTDGRIWSEVTPGWPDEVSTGAMVTEADGAVILEMFGSGAGGTARFITRDGRTFERLSSWPPTGHRYESDVGWVATSRSSPTLWVSPDGEDWESHRLSSLHGIEHHSRGLVRFGEMSVIDASIYVVVDAGDDARAVLLIGEITPPG